MAAFVGLFVQRADATRTPLPVLSDNLASAVIEAPADPAAAIPVDAPADAWLIEKIIPLGQAENGEHVELVSFLVPLSSLDEIDPTSTRAGPDVELETRTRVVCTVRPPLGLNPWKRGS